MSRYSASELNYEEVTVLGHPALFTGSRIDRATVPEGMYRYEMRHSDENWNKPVEVAHRIAVNFYGTVLTREPFQLPIAGWLPLEKGSIKSKHTGCNSLAEFQQKYPVSEKEVIEFFTVNDTGLHDLYFSQSEERDKATGCIGHLRGDFGNGRQFYTTWWPHQNDVLNTPEFKADIARTVNWLREQPDSPLRDFDTLKRCCDRYQRTCTIQQAILPSCGFMAQTKRYVYMLRCSPTKGDYQFYMYCYQRENFEKARIQPEKDSQSLNKNRSEPER